MAYVVDIQFFNTFILRAADQNTVHVEESRIKGGFNEASAGLGPKAYITNENYEENKRANALIYSGIYNSKTDVNKINVFSAGDKITRSVDPVNGGIEKLHAEDTNLLIFQEDKVSRALIDKDALFTAEGGQLTASGAAVIGQIIPFAGKYGISKNPESFALKGNRKYFTDKSRGAVLRLSRDGITEISKAGMKDWFKDNLSTASKIVGMYDDNLDQYVLNIKNNTEYNTLAFEEDVKGWTSFYSYNPDFGFSINKNFYTIKDNYIWDHGTLNPSRNYFYDGFEESSITFVVNAEPSVVKSFNTINYEGSPDWVMESSETDLAMKSWPIRKSSTSIGSGVLGTSFIKKENKYYSHIRNNTTLTAKNQIIGVDVSGIKGFFTTVKMKHDSTTNEVELFTVSHNIVKSS
jgi:hypothetical protein